MKPQQRLYAWLVLLATALQIPAVSAQSRDYDIDLRGDMVPLYDCRIFSDFRDRRECNNLRRNVDSRWERMGHAVSCYDMRNRIDRSNCFDFSQNLTRYASSMINCSQFRHARVDRDRCETVRRAYINGYFPAERMSAYDNVTTTTTVVVNERPRPQINQCDGQAYDRAMENWRVQTEERRRRGSKRAVVGAVATIGGLLLGSSDNRTVRAVGEGVTVGGLLLTTWGLVDVMEADLSMPHMSSYCRNSYVSETRMVVVERQECVTTRYYEGNRYSSRYYTEVKCQNRRYVTFEEFEPWDSGRPVRY